MNQRLIGAAMAALAAALIVAACSDSTIAPQASPTNYSSETSIQIMNPTTGVLTKYTPGFKTGPGVALSTTAPASQPAMLLADNAASVSHIGAAHTSATTIDAQKHKHQIIYLYSQNGPPTAVQHYIDGKLVTETKNSWTKITGGWYRSLTTLQVINPTTGAILSSQAIEGTYTVVTKPCDPKVTSSCGPPQTVLNNPDTPPTNRIFGDRLFGYAGLALANVFAPADALAQSSIPGLFGPCTQEWLTYQAAGLALAVAAVALAACPECGITEAAFAAAMFATAKAEDALLNCEIKSQFADGGGAAGGSSGAGSGGSGDFGGCGNGIVTQGCIYIDEYTQ